MMMLGALSHLTLVLRHPTLSLKSFLKITSDAKGLQTAVFAH